MRGGWGRVRRQVGRYIIGATEFAPGWPYLLKHGEVYATEGHGAPCSRHSIRITVSVEHLEGQGKEGAREG